MAINWKRGGELYLPTLNAAEVEYSIPTDLLARIAFEECSWRPEVIDGTVKSTADCIGLMQLNVRYYPDAGQDWHQDVQDAAELLVADYRRFQDWQAAIASYNDGAGNIDLWLKGQRALPTETCNYVGQIVADVPVNGCVVPL